VGDGGALGGKLGKEFARMSPSKPTQYPMRVCFGERID
jgi:hypothetical protein